MTEIKNELQMPSLSELETSLCGKRLLGRILGVHGPPFPRGLQIADGYVRLVEKTLIEYVSVRDAMSSYMSDGNFDSYCRAQDHMETCLQSLHRAIIYLDRLRRMGLRKSDNSPFVPRPSELEVLNQGVIKQVRDIRDACEHLDEDIINGKIADDAEVAIHLDCQCAALAGYAISYSDLSRWITQLHHFAVLLSRVEITIGSPANDNNKDA